MRGKKAKKLRRLVYGDVATKSDARTYVHSARETRVAGWRRREYKRLKRTGDHSPHVRASLVVLGGEAAGSRLQRVLPFTARQWTQLVATARKLAAWAERKGGGAKDSAHTHA